MLRNTVRVVVSIFTIVLVALLLACVQQDTRTDAQAPKTAYIIQAGSLDQALRAANHVDAEITHRLGIINAVGAELTPSQVEILRGMEGVKVLVNRTARVASASQFVYDDNAYPIEDFESQGTSGSACQAYPEYERTFNVSDNFIIDDLNVGIDVEHNYRGNLRVNLTSPAGTTVTLVEQVTEGDYWDNYNFYLDDESSGIIHDNANHGIGTTFERSVSPDNALSAFDGQQANGTWTLAFCNTDVTGSSGGRILHYGGPSYGGAQLLFTASDDQPSTSEVETIRDEFLVEKRYDGNDGSLDWSGPWIEFDDNDPDGGIFRAKKASQCVAGSCILIETGDGLGKYIYREANFDGAESAILTYSFYHELEDGDEVVAEISKDGGATYQVLKTYNENVQYKQPSNETIDVTAWMSPETLIRFRITAVDEKKKMWIDNVEFELNFYVPNATHAEFIEATDLHAEGTQGSGVTVAVLDTGYWPHPALDYNSQGQGRVLIQYNAITNQKDAVGLPTVATDINGHGTYVTSVLMSSEKTNGKSHGVAPMANLVSVKAFGADGTGSYLDVIRGIDYVVSNKNTFGIRVLNLSFSAPPQSLYWQDPLAQAVMAAWDAGLVVVTSAGNRGPEPMSIGVPGVVPYVITVGYMSDAFTFDDRSDDYLSSYSSTGPTFAGFIKPDVVAPGGHLIGLMPPDSRIAKMHPQLHDGEDYFEMSGTSQAAAVTSGVVALLLETDATLVPDDVKCRLMATTRTAITDDNTLAYSVFQQGAGLINARRAVKANVGTGCANRGLDLTADRYDKQHYTGPARYDPAIGFYINGASSAFNWDTQYSWDGFSWVDGNPFVDADGNPFVDADGNPFVDIDGSPFVDADGNPFVDLDGNPFVDADGNPFVDADGNPFVDADGNPFVDADGNPFVDADGNPFVDLDGNPFVDTDGNPFVDEINRAGINFWVDLD